MPNHVTTRMTVVGTPEMIAELFEYIKRDSNLEVGEEESLFDFNKVIPIPEGVDWYSWSIKNWGTKWNAYDITQEGEDTLEFLTAWSHPYPVIAELAKKFPDVTINILFADEDTGYNVGDYSLHGNIKTDKSPENGSNEAYELAFEVSGGADRYHLVDGKYEYNEDAD